MLLPLSSRSRRAEGGHLCTAMLPLAGRFTSWVFPRNVPGTKEEPEPPLPTKAAPTLIRDKSYTALCKGKALIQVPMTRQLGD